MGGGRWPRRKIGQFPVNFPVIGKNAPETGSQQTAPTAKQSVVQRYLWRRIQKAPENQTMYLIFRRFFFGKGVFIHRL
jgi:hypothetical protein